MITRRYLSLLALLLLSASAHAQGSLIPPPGPPAASMKTLDQLEARKPVQSLAAAAPYTISQPGSYYLTGNITVASGDAIVVNSDDVSIDLNGFTIRSTQSGGRSGQGITFAKDISRLSVRNGSIVSTTTVPVSGVITDQGFERGIGAAAFDAAAAVVTDVHVSGIAAFGIQLRASGVIERCTATHCGGTGLTAQTISNCTAERCQAGIDAVTAVNCHASATTGTALFVHSCATNCRGISVSGVGLRCNGTAANCRGDSNGNVGLDAVTAAHCYGTSFSQPGILVAGTASFCHGIKYTGGVAIQASIAIGCTKDVDNTIVAPQKHLGTP